MVIENVDKIAITEVTKVLSANNLSSEYNWMISNIDIDTARVQGLTSFKKYWRYYS